MKESSMLMLGGAFVATLGVLFVLVSLFLMLVILIQKPKGGGLSGAFGGAGGAVQTAFGSKVGDLLTWVTVVGFALFLLLAMFLTWEINAEAGSGGGAGTAASHTPPTSGGGK
jgi:preprotein translocase subunit SecG